LRKKNNYILYNEKNIRVASPALLSLTTNIGLIYTQIERDDEYESYIRSVLAGELAGYIITLIVLLIIQNKYDIKIFIVLVFAYVILTIIILALTFEDLLYYKLTIIFLALLRIMLISLALYKV
jgi:hypothetical protein